MAEWNKNKKRNETIRQLRKDGYSIPSIAKMLKCSKSITSYHCKNVKPKTFDKINTAISLNSIIGAEGQKNKWKIKKLEVIKEAKDEWMDVRKNSDLMSFINLYWAEGDKSNKSCRVGVVNNDPGVIKCCLNHFKKLTNKKLHVIVRCYPDLDVEKCENFWNKITGLPIEIMVRKEIGKYRKPTSKYGTCTVKFNDWPVRYKIMTWIKCFREELCGKEEFEHIEEFHGLKM